MIICVPNLLGTPFQSIVLKLARAFTIKMSAYVALKPVDETNVFKDRSSNPFVYLMCGMSSCVVFSDVEYGGVVVCGEILWVFPGVMGFIKERQFWSGEVGYYSYFFFQFFFFTNFIELSVLFSSIIDITNELVGIFICSFDI